MMLLLPVRAGTGGRPTLQGSYRLSSKPQGVPVALNFLTVQKSDALLCLASQAIGVIDLQLYKCLSVSNKTLLIVILR